MSHHQLDSAKETLRVHGWQRSTMEVKKERKVNSLVELLWHSFM